MMATPLSEENVDCVKPVISVQSVEQLNDGKRDKDNYFNTVLAPKLIANSCSMHSLST